MKKAEVVHPARVIHLNDHWSAVELSDGRLLLQHRYAHVYGSGEAVHLAKLEEPGSELVADSLRRLGSDRLLVRCMYLEPNGSVFSDPMGVSPGGEPAEMFCLLQPASESSGLYMQIHQKSFERIMAGEEEF